jgi:Na+-transporting methylmalonyl-CoA/oxaloacetate decarboxylase gamma subunit
MFAFPFILILHAWGMGIIAGGNAAIDLRILGFAPRVPLSAMAKFYPVMWFGFAINAISGFLLLMGYPTKALTNPVFYLKLLCIAVGMVLMSRLRRRVVPEDSPPPNAKVLAALSLIVWAGAIVSGRLLAYTCKYLLGDLSC